MSIARRVVVRVDVGGQKAQVGPFVPWGHNHSSRVRRNDLIPPRFDDEAVYGRPVGTSYMVAMSARYRLAMATPSSIGLDLDESFDTVVRNAMVHAVDVVLAPQVVRIVHTHQFRSVPFLLLAIVDNECQVS
ncbi:hypothetical protein BD311DRAFT_764698 [Dichomitus squalens]|uniref:Uncharacterized protein n=1 Tax=Dichomitus squalens TaxID=114155 RepID=A0A4Q9MDK3_9APHY|nr:hypothetical protein BD311DRAFT_764698 [Dichomitus squalens]